MALEEHKEFDLQTLIATPESTLGEIETVISSDFRDDWVWVVVEGSDDVEIYKPLFNPETTRVRNSIDEVQKCSWSNVENIVTTILSTFNFDKIIGIRDADYTIYDSSYQLPPHIFRTDTHDIEILILQNQQFLNGMRAKKPHLVADIQKAYTVMRHTGYLRAYSISIGAGFNFEGDIKMKNFWDQERKTAIPHWRNKLYANFFSTHATEYGQAPDKEGFKDYVRKHQLCYEPSEKICQGHDVVSYLEWTGAITRPYEQFNLYFNLEAFKSTGLYMSLSQWQTTNHQTLF